MVARWAEVAGLIGYKNKDYKPVTGEEGWKAVLQVSTVLVYPLHQSTTFMYTTFVPWRLMNLP